MKEKKILIIDDEKGFTDVLKLNLESTGRYKVMVEIRGKSALSAAKKFQPDLILLDIRMPDMNGFEVLTELKSDLKTTSIPVVMLTAVGGEKARERSLGLYDEGYLVKPVTSKDLMEKIESVFEMRQFERSSEDFVVTEKTKQTEAIKGDAKKGTRTKKRHESKEIKILIIDDEKSDCEFIEDLLEARGFQTHACWEPEQAMDVFSRLKPDIVILDLVMPKVDGMEILKNIREQGSDAIIIVLTAVKDPVVIKDAIGLGADDYIIKPFSIDQLHATVVKHLRITNKKKTS